jgi:hypothetical protein
VTPDQLKRHCEENGAPFLAARAFKPWIDQLPQSLQAGGSLTTVASWPRWREQALDGSLHRSRSDLAPALSLVRYPADGIAYVIAPRLYPDHDEPVVITQPTQMLSLFFTLLFEDGRWRVHAVGPMVAPSDLGKTAYSW